jgi:hypothetical protein
MSRSPLRPRRLRALVVVAALSASMFAASLPASADSLANGGGKNVSTNGWIWTR